MMLNNSLFQKLLFSLLLSFSLTVWAQQADSEPMQGFQNPIVQSGADPWGFYYQGNYYLLSTTWSSRLTIRKSATLAGLKQAPERVLWAGTDPSRCCHFWSPELHRLKGPKGYRWYLLYTAGVKDHFGQQHLNVLESAGDDPMGPYLYKGAPLAHNWSISGSYWNYQDKLYLLWSEWQGNEQVIRIANMTNPWTIQGEGSVLFQPKQEWERAGLNVNEAPVILSKEQDTYLIFSASFCHTPEYKLGMAQLVGSDPMNPAHWQKQDEPAFSKIAGVYGPGHSSYFESPDGQELWMLYHANDLQEEGCTPARSIRAKRIEWPENSSPQFGQPDLPDVIHSAPSGEQGPLTVTPKGLMVELSNEVTGLCLGQKEGQLVQQICDQNELWSLDWVANQQYRLAHAQSGLFVGKGQPKQYGEPLELAPWQNSNWQLWQIQRDPSGASLLVNQASELRIGVEGCLTSGALLYRDERSFCSQWQLRPAGEVALVSAQSGKAMAIEYCEQNEVNAVQKSWQGACQRWQFKPAQGGYFYLTQNSACLMVTGSGSVPGDNAILGECSGDQSQWRPEFLSDGSIRLMNRRSGLPLDLAHCGYGEDVNLAQGPWQDLSCQKFFLLSVP